MTQSHSLVLHREFKKQCNEVKKLYSGKKLTQIDKQITTTLLQIRSNPSAFKSLKDVIKGKLSGIVRRVYVGGNNGHRLFYLYLTEKQFIIPIFISKELRRDFDYGDTSWIGPAEKIYEDILSGNYDTFTKY